RATAREKEIAVRLALGAGRRRVIRQLLTETLILFIAGGLAGIALSYWSKGLLTTLFPRSDSTLYDLRVDTRVLFFTGALSLICAVLFGIVPAFRATLTKISTTMKENARTFVGGHNRFRKTLLVA